MENTKKAAKNIIMLYTLNMAQLILPFLTLPYLTRILSLENYGVVSYVKSIMMYMTLVIEFGFVLSGTKLVVEAKKNKKNIGRIVGTITQCKLILSFFSFIFLLLLITWVPLLNKHVLFTLLSFVPSFLTIFLCDYLFRGLEKMQIVSVRYIVMKGISTFLTFIIIKGDSQLLLIPVLDILGSLVAVAWIFSEIKKMNIEITFSGFSTVYKYIKESFIYFVSDMASTAFGAFNTFCIGIFLSARDIAFWGVLMSIITAVQSMFTPISDGIYPRMIDTKSIKLFLKILFFFIPFLIIGSFITYFGSDLILTIIGGSKYTPAAIYLRESIPLIVISFFSIICGWPLLGSINKIKQTTFTTMLSAVIQVTLMFALIAINSLTITLSLVTRTITEFVLASMRIILAFKYRKLFNTK